MMNLTPSDTIASVGRWAPGKHHMQIELDNLTAQERIDWEAFVKWHNDNGWVGDEARRLAWADLQKKYQRLQEFSDVT